MTETVVRVEGIGKRYKIGADARASHSTLRDSLAATPRRVLARLRDGHTRSQEFWALRDIDLEITEGNILALVGHNGAGKSTLLKILSRIVEPTTGRIVMHGRVSSLLEVGTGFHTELTGRENVYLNGAILGMQRREIRSKFEEIVEFSGIEEFLDTPVKFYSSGMYVRLAFAVAAHLEPEILIVDEVLAVGDRAFQAKSLGKMSSVARSGRTVIFVSHNMSAVLDLCTHGALIEDGHLALFGPIGEVVGAYTLLEGGEHDDGRFERDAGSERVIARATVQNDEGVGKKIFAYGERLRIQLETTPVIEEQFGIEVRVKNGLGQPVAYASSWIRSEARFRAGDAIEIALPVLPLTEDTYTVDFYCRIPGEPVYDSWSDAVTFSVVGAEPGFVPLSLKASDQIGAVVLENAVFTRS